MVRFLVCLQFVRPSPLITTVLSVKKLRGRFVALDVRGRCFLVNAIAPIERFASVSLTLAMIGIRDTGERSGALSGLFHRCESRAASDWMNPHCDPK